MTVTAPHYTIWIRDPLTLTRMLRLDQFTTLEYGRRWQDVGDFTLTLPDGIADIDRIVANPGGYGVALEVRRSDLPFCEFLGFVSYQQLQQDASGGGMWTLKGWNAPGEVVRRLALPSPLTTNDLSTTAGADYDITTGVTVAQAARHYVNDNCIEPYEPERIVSLLRLGTVRRANPRPAGVVLPLDWTTVSVTDTEAMIIITWQARYRDLMGDVVASICKAGNAGFEFVLGDEAGTYQFDIVLPADRRRGSGSGYAPVTLTARRGSLGAASYENNGMELRNAIYAAAGGVATLRVMTISKAPGGGSTDWINPDPRGDPFISPASIQMWGRREGLLDTGSSGTGSSDAAAAEARAAISAYADTQRLTFQPRDTDVEGYRKTWDVGDSIRAVVQRKGFRGQSDPQPITAAAPISEVRVKVATGAVPEVTVSLGAPPRTLLDVIREISKGTRPAAAV